MGMDWHLRVCWLVVLRQVFVGLMCFGGDGFKDKSPYGSAEGIRMEDGSDMDVESEGLWSRKWIFFSTEFCFHNYERSQ